MKKPLLYYLALTAVFSVASYIWPAVSPAAQPLPAAGELWGKPVSKETFDDAYKTTSYFLVGGAKPVKESEKRAEAWKHLIFLNEADKRGITVSREELEKELSRLF